MPTKSLKQEAVSGMRLQNPKARDERIDSVKFWLIVLVISDHVIMRKEFADSAACTVLWNWICLFAMPLFIFLSGYYSRKKDWKDFWPSIWKLLEPLILFHVIGLLFYKNSISIKAILSPWHELWYLLSLIYWRFMLQVIPERILKHKIIFLTSAFCISILAGFLPFDRILSLQRTLSLMPFFFLGYYLRRGGQNLYLPNKYKPLCIVFLIAIFAILFIYPHRSNYLLYATPYKHIYGAAIRMLAFAVAIPMSIAFINVCYHTSWIARQGRMSLQYYIYHALLIPPNSSVIMPPLIAIACMMDVPMNFVTAAIIIAATTIGLSIVLKIPYIKLLTNPSSFFVTKNNETK